MIRVNKWPGVITAASPYIIPSGGEVEQINAKSTQPGQLTVRGGMALLSSTCSGTVAGCADLAATGGLLEIWGYNPGAGGGGVLFGLTTDGELVRLTGLEEV